MLTYDAMERGHSLFLATNGMLLCKGPLPAEFVEELSREELGPEWRE